MSTDRESSTDVNVPLDVDAVVDTLTTTRPRVGRPNKPSQRLRTSRDGKKRKVEVQLYEKTVERVDRVAWARRTSRAAIVTELVERHYGVKAMRFHRQSGSGVYVSEDDPSMFLLLDVGAPDTVRAPDALGGMELRVLSSFAHKCPRSDCHEKTLTLELEDGLYVAECPEHAFQWFRLTPASAPEQDSTAQGTKGDAG